MKYLEYIQSQQNCRIDTGYTALSISRILLKVNVQTGYNNYGAFFANSGNTSSGARYFALFVENSGFQFRTGNVPGTPFPFVVDTDYEIDCIRPTSSFTVNGVAGSTAGLGTMNDNNLYLFWDPAWNSSSRHVYFKLYYCKMYDNNDTLVRDYIPVEDENGVGCLFDNITEQYYYTPAGTFIKGPEVEPPPLPTGEFPITIQKNNSEPIHLTKDLTDILSTYVWLKEDTSIIDPVFVLEATLSDLVEANYVTVPTFGRSYFITNITSITTNLVELTCHVDVLSSFADEIKANKGIIFRQENDWNLYLNDGVIQAYQNPIITTQLFPKGFTQQNFVLVAAGSRGIGSIGVGQGGSIDIDVSDGGGAGNTSSKTTAGLIAYCKAQIGNPYWFGTFGNIASQALLDYKREQYPTYYPDPGSPDFTTQFGQRVHDCVGLIKGYRWSDTSTSAPQYVISEDVDVRGLYTQCNRMRGNVDFAITSTVHLEGMLVFDAAMTHVGVYIGNGKIIEAQGHAYGVVQNNAYDRRAKFTLWGVPDWLQVTTSMS